MNIFERASRKALRFSSSKGDLTTEQLWSLSLPALDTIAKSVYSSLQEAGSFSFVSTEADPKKADLELRLDILKHVIASKLADKDAAATRADNKAKKEALMRTLEAKQNMSLMNLSEEELVKEIEKLS